MLMSWIDPQESLGLTSDRSRNSFPIVQLNATNWCSSLDPTFYSLLMFEGSKNPATQKRSEIPRSHFKNMISCDPCSDITGGDSPLKWCLRNELALWDSNNLDSCTFHFTWSKFLFIGLSIDIPHLSFSFLGPINEFKITSITECSIRISDITSF